jgi:hypothetical protein
MTSSPPLGLFRQHGYHGVGLDQIAEAVGLAGPSVYVQDQGVESAWFVQHISRSHYPGPARYVDTC